MVELFNIKRISHIAISKHHHNFNLPADYGNRFFWRARKSLRNQPSQFGCIQWISKWVENIFRLKNLNNIWCISLLQKAWYYNHVWEICFSLKIRAMYMETTSSLTINSLGFNLIGHNDFKREGVFILPLRGFDALIYYIKPH